MNSDNGDNLSSIHPLLEPLHTIILPIIIGKRPDADFECIYGIVELVVAATTNSKAISNFLYRPEKNVRELKNCLKLLSLSLIDAEACLISRVNKLFNLFLT